MEYLRLACHPEQNSSSFKDMRFTGNSRKTVNGTGTSCPTVKPFFTGNRDGLRKEIAKTILAIEKE